MTGRWLMLSEAARCISAATGKSVSLDDVIALGGDDGPLQAQFMHGYWSVLEESVTAYLESVSECAGEKAEDVAGNAKPRLHPRDPANPAEAEMTTTDEDLYRGEKST